MMSSANESPDIQSPLELFIPLHSDELVLRGYENDPYDLDPRGPLTPCTDRDETGFWLELEEFVKPLKATHWEVNGKIDTAVAEHLAACPDSITDFPQSELPSCDLSDDSDSDSHVSDESDESEDVQSRDNEVQRPLNAQLQKANEAYVRALVHNEYEMEFGPLCVCQWLPSNEAHREPVGMKMESPSKETKKRYWEEAFREQRHQLSREQRRIENYGRLF